jgi:hypothetical protein
MHAHVRFSTCFLVLTRTPSVPSPASEGKTDARACRFQQPRQSQTGIAPTPSLTGDDVVAREAAVHALALLNFDTTRSFQITSHLSLKTSSPHTPAPLHLNAHLSLHHHLSSSAASRWAEHHAGLALVLHLVEHLHSLFSSTSSITPAPSVTKSTSTSTTNMSDWDTSTAPVEPAGAAPATDGEAAGDAWGSGGDATEAAEEPAVEHVTKKLDKAELVEKARAAGWNETTAFNYEEFQRTGGNDTNWYGSARVYEWKDEYGEVGPEVPELEDILFGGEFVMRQGEHMGALHYNVQQEGPKRIQPVAKVSLPSPISL